MRRHLLILLGALVVASSCASAKGTTGKAKAITAPSSPTTSAPATTTSAPPETTTAPPAPPPTAALTAVVTSPTGVVLPVVGRDPAGALVSTPCSRQAVLGTWNPI